MIAASTALRSARPESKPNLWRNLSGCHRKCAFLKALLWATKASLDVAPRPGIDAASAADIHALWPRNGDLPEDAPGGGPVLERGGARRAPGRSRDRALLSKCLGTVPVVTVGPYQYEMVL